MHLRETQDPGQVFEVRGVLEPGSQGSGQDPARPEPARDEPARADDDALELIADLCKSLDAEGVRYCHWKSNESIARSASGENDLDLLVRRSDAERFEGILRRLGFKDTHQPGWKQLPGVYHS